MTRTRVLIVSEYLGLILIEYKSFYDVQSVDFYVNLIDKNKEIGDLANGQVLVKINEINSNIDRP
jgi:hypothetical protein